MITNGHLNDYRDEAREYHMPSQLFHSLNGRFREVDASNAGAWFEKKHHNRGRVTVDRNCVGGPEFIVSVINALAAVLTNTSTGVGNCIRLKRHVTSTARDIIVTHVTFKTDKREYSRQLLAGEGYECVVSFGIGKAKAVDEAHLACPSNSLAVLQRPCVNSTYIISEDVRSPAQCGQSEFRSSPLTTEDAAP